jgi:Mg2+-importing ATPase
MLLFGPISSIFDFATFGVMLGIFHAAPALFQSGWFVESLLTQTLIIFAIRTRRIPFFRSRASWPLTVTSLAVVVVGATLPFTPLARVFGFVPLPPAFFAILLVMIATYLLLVELGKTLFFRRRRIAPATPDALKRRRRLFRLASRWVQRPVSS